MSNQNGQAKAHSIMRSEKHTVDLCYYYLSTGFGHWFMHFQSK